jgi:hypothetical protein
MGADYPGRSVLVVLAEDYAELRAVRRALTPSVGGAATLPDENDFRHIHQRLRVMRARLRSRSAETALSREDAEELEHVRGALDALAQKLLAFLEQLPMAQLRATLPEMAESHRPEVEALLHLCVRSQEVYEKLSYVVDYVVTLLSTINESGVRRLVTHPASLTARLAAFCNAAASSDAARVAEVADVFATAARELHNASDTEPILARMREYKQSAFEELMTPDVLVRVVEYNVAVFNRRAALIEIERELDEIDIDEDDAGDEELLHEAEFSGANHSPERPMPMPSVVDLSEPEVDPGSLEPVAVALALRARGDAPEPGPAADVALRADFELLSPEELQLLTGADTSAETDPTVSAIVLGLVLQQGDAPRAELEAIEVDLDGLRRVRLPETQDRMRDEIQRLVALGEYEEARARADTKTKLLPFWLQTELRGRQIGSTELYMFDSVEEDRTGQGGRRSIGAVFWRTVALAACLVIALIAASAIKKEGDAVELSEDQLRAVSPYLEDGHRNRRGRGGVFIGTVHEGWYQIDPKRRHKEAIALMTRLAQDGVREAMLFDENRVLQVHVSRGRLQFPKAPPRPEPEPELEPETAAPTPPDRLDPPQAKRSPRTP